MATEDLTGTMQLSVRHDDVKFYFVTESGTPHDASRYMKYSFEIIADFSFSTDHLEWISEDDCISLPSASSLTEQIIFILDKFEGKVFEYLFSTKAVVLGPQCVLRCQLTNDVVPNISSPIFTLAMKNVVACVSGISRNKRAEIHKLIGFMGGLCTSDLMDSNTHLISNTIMSLKYEKAALTKTKIMKEEWVFDMWALCKSDVTSFSEVDFYKKYKLPIFHNLVITSSGLPKKDINEITKLIQNNSGEYNESFKRSTTDILISQPNQKNSEKFKAAVKYKKQCLTVDWVKDSVTMGYAMPFVNYRINTGQATSALFTSTQISSKSLMWAGNSTQLAAFFKDFATGESTIVEPIPKSTSTQFLLEYNYKEIFANIDMSQVKNANGCLDGCSIWLCGFDAKETVKLKKIINICGAIRFDEYDLNVDYVIVGKPNSVGLSILKSLKSSNIVTVDWLVASINTKTIADQKEFIYQLELSNSDSNQTVNPSLASRKIIESMRPVRNARIVPRRLHWDEEENENNLLARYTKPTTSETKSDRDSSGDLTETSDAFDSEMVNSNLLQRHTLAIFGFSDEMSDILKTDIEEVGGINVEDGDVSQIVDYLVITANTHSLNEVNHKAKEIVTEIWIQECLAANKMVDIEYYHRPILLKEDVKPLRNLNIVFSTYSLSERDYLTYLVRALGGEVIDRHARNQSPILVCPTPNGQKYNGAIKWDLPVVSCEWLKKCYELEKKVSLHPYLVGEAKWQDDDMQNISKVPNEPNIRSSKSDTSHTSEESYECEKADKSDGGSKKDRSPFNIQESNKYAADLDSDEKTTPVRHSRVSAIINSANRQASSLLSQSPSTPGDSIAKYVEDIPTPISRGLVFDILKEFEENESPLSRRIRISNVTDSPIDMSALDPPDYFEIIDRKFIEIPKARPSTPFVEYRKRMYIKVLGDQYDGSPLSRPFEENVEEKKKEQKRNNAGATTTAEQQTTVEIKNTEKEHLAPNNFHIVAKFVQSRIGTTLLSHDGFTYGKNGVINGTTHWRCSRKIRCKARARTKEINGIVMMKLNQTFHTHPKNNRISKQQKLP